MSDLNNKYVQNYVNLKDKFGLLIIDECHKLGANNFLNILNIWGES